LSVIYLLLAALAIAGCQAAHGEGENASVSALDCAQRGQAFLLGRCHTFCASGCSEKSVCLQLIDSCGECESCDGASFAGEPHRPRKDGEAASEPLCASINELRQLVAKGQSLTARDVRAATELRALRTRTHSVRECVDCRGAEICIKQGRELLCAIPCSHSRDCAAGDKCDCSMENPRRSGGARHLCGPPRR
jgi:hypothetical protein